MAGPIIGQDYTFVITLFDSAGAAKVNPTIQAGDAKIRHPDGTVDNMDTLPVVSPAGSIFVLVTVTAAELTGMVAVNFTDVAGAEWATQTFLINPDTADLSTLNTAVAALPTAAAVWTYAGVRSLTTFGTLVADVAAAVWSAATRELTGFGTLVALIWTYVTRSLTVYGSSGAVATAITIDDGTNPLDGAFVWITTDVAGTHVIAQGYTDAFGIVTFYLDPGTYYVWKQAAGYSFTNPETTVVV